MASTNEDDRTDTDNSERDDDRDENAEGKSDAHSDEQEGEEAASTETEDPAKDEPAAKSKPAAKPAAATAKSSSAAAKKPAGVAKRPVGSAGVKGARKPIAARPRTSGSMVKTMILFLIILGGLGAAFFLLSPQDGASVPAPKWNTGQTVDVEITLVHTDAKDLACASTEEIAGRKCEFETQAKPRPKAEGDEADRKLLKPYTTTDRVQFLAAGIWSDPGLKGKLPASRFSVKCKYTVEGKIKKPGIRWSTDWYDPGGDWYAGVVSGCALVP
jgi:hypothetical protein